MDTSQYLANEALSQLRDDLRDIASRYQQIPLTLLLSDLVELQDTIFTLMDRRYRATEIKHIYTLGGLVSGMLAKASHDMGDPRGAIAHTRTGFLCADQAEDDGLRGWVRGMQSFITYWDDRPQEAIRYAKEGRIFAERSNNSALAWIASNEARAWAKLQNVNAAQEAIVLSERAIETVQPDEVDELGGICTFQRSRQLYYAADALVQLSGCADQAEGYANRALEAYGNSAGPDWSFSDQAGSSIDLALARIQRGQVDGASEALQGVLELEPARRINGISSSLSNVQAQLRVAPESSEVTNLMMEIEAFQRTPLAALP